MAVKYKAPDEGLKERLSPFLKNNPFSKLIGLEFNGQNDGDLRVESPWGDDSLSFFLFYKDHDENFKILNSVKLPKLLSAILHVADKRLEVLWTARRLEDAKLEAVNRKFEFRLKGKVYKCRYGDSSDAALKLADLASLRQSSGTLYRNLQSFKDYVAETDVQKRGREYGKPRSFYIEKFSLDDEETVEFVQHLNFYMGYYDSATPRILLHLSESTTSTFNRYVRGDFPPVIKARQLDANLLSFWGAIRTTNPMLDFVIAYRIIEYASIHFVEHDVLAKINKVISSPNFGNDKIKDLEEIAFIANVKVEEHQRIDHLLANAPIHKDYGKRSIRIDCSFPKTLFLTGSLYKNP